MKETMKYEVKLRKNFEIKGIHHENHSNDTK